MKKFRRIFVIVLDSLGIGAMTDAGKYGDEGADTLGHIDASVKDLKLTALESLGLGNLCSLKHVDPAKAPKAYYARLNEASTGKDTMTGHWEMMGLLTTKPFRTFTETGFPEELIRELEKKTGHAVVGNKAVSGTEILDELGEHQIETGDMIVYTSADSVLQIAGNEETFGLEELYRCCRIAREITMKDEWKVGRVIARPYVGRKKGQFVRTANRHDYAVSPSGPTALDIMKKAGFDVIGIGKIYDIFNGQGITEKYTSKSSVHGMDQTIEAARRQFEGLAYINLVDFDALWGHRRDPQGYAAELERFDRKLQELLPLIKEEDLLMITADHGNDPTFHGTDHTREQVPLLVYSPGLKGGSLPEQATFGVTGSTILENFGLEPAEGMIGTSLNDLLK